MQLYLKKTKSSLFCDIIKIQNSLEVVNMEFSYQTILFILGLLGEG